MIVYTAEVYSKYLEHKSVYLGKTLEKSDVDRIKELYMNNKFQNGDPWYDRIEVVEHKVERECDVCGGGHTTIVVGTYTNPNSESYKKLRETVEKYVLKKDYGAFRRDVSINDIDYREKEQLVIKFGKDFIKFIRKNQKHDFFILQEYEENEPRYINSYENLEDALYEYEFGAYADAKYKKIIAEDKNGIFEGVIISNF